MTRADLPKKYADRLAFSPSEVGELVGRSKTCIMAEVTSGRLAARRVGGGRERASWVVSFEALAKWLSGDDEAQG